MINPSLDRETKYALIRGGYDMIVEKLEAKDLPVHAFYLSYVPDPGVPVWDKPLGGIIIDVDIERIPERPKNPGKHWYIAANTPTELIQKIYTALCRRKKYIYDVGVIYADLKPSDRNYEKYPAIYRDTYKRFHGYGALITQWDKRIPGGVKCLTD